MAAARALKEACAPGAASTAAPDAVPGWTTGRWMVHRRWAASSFDNKRPAAPSPMPQFGAIGAVPAQALVGPAAPLPSSAPPGRLLSDPPTWPCRSRAASRQGDRDGMQQRSAGRQEHGPEAIDRRLPHGQVLHQASRRPVFGRHGAKGSLAAAFAAVRPCPGRSSSGRDSVCPLRRPGWWASVAASAGAGTACPASRAIWVAGPGGGDRGLPWPGSCAGEELEQPSANPLSFAVDQGRAGWRG